MNLPYIVAVVLTDGDAFVDQFSASASPIGAAGVLPGSRGCRPGDRRGWRWHAHATHPVTLRDGRVLEDERRHAGLRAAALGAADVRVKFDKLAIKAVSAERASTIADLVATIEARELDELAAALD